MATGRLQTWAKSWFSNGSPSHTDYIPLDNPNAGTSVHTVSERESASANIYRRLSTEHDAEDDAADADDTKESYIDSSAPSSSDLLTLREVPDRIPAAAFSIVIVELCERFAYYGLSGVFQNYLQHPLPPNGNGAGAPASMSDPAPAGALNLGQASATRWQNVFSFLAYVTPVLGAVVADVWWGRFKTITVFCMVYFVGLMTITGTSMPVLLKDGWGLPGWIIGAAVVAIGTGGIKANVSPLIADQYRQTSPFLRTLPSGERVIVDPTLTLSRIYNLFYWCINVGSLSAIVTTQLERRYGFWAAFLLPTCVFLGTPILLGICRKMYYRVPPRGSIVVEAWRVLQIVVKGWWVGKGKHSSDDIWALALPSSSASSPIPTTPITWDASFVSELRRTLHASQIALFLPLYWVAYSQLSTNLISQAATLSSASIPNDVLPNVDPVALLILIPVMDIWVYPWLRARGWKMGPIFRIWMGFVCAAVAMSYCAVVQWGVYNSNPCGEWVGSGRDRNGDRCEGKSWISIFVQVPAYVLIALSEIFASITSIEYAYNKAPARMKSVVMSIFLLSTAVGNVINIALSPLAQNPYLVFNYTVISIGVLVTGNVFYWCFRHRDEREEEENAVGKDKGTELDSE